MIKIVALLKKRPDMTTQEFIDYYENNHAPLAKTAMRAACHYTRRYLRPLPGRLFMESQEQDFDVVTEVWFDSREAYDDAIARLTDPAFAPVIKADEEKLFDRSRISSFLVEEHHSDMRLATISEPGIL